MSPFNRDLWINSAGSLWARLVTMPGEQFWRWDPFPKYNADEALMWRLLDRAHLGPTSVRWNDWASVTPFRDADFFSRAGVEDVVMYFLALQRGEKFSEGAIGVEFDSGRLVDAWAALIRYSGELPFDVNRLLWLDKSN